MIFGGDGDLSKRKIIPAFYNRFVDGQLEMPFKIICITRSLDDEKAFKATLTEFIAKTVDKEGVLDKIDAFMSRLELLKIPKTSKELFAPLRKILMSEKDWQRIFYFSVPSSAFSEICNTLKASDLINADSKVVLEKPLGYSLKSGREINEIISEAFKETQIFRIDHYLGERNRTKYNGIAFCKSFIRTRLERG